MTGHMLGGIHRPVLPAGTAETHHQLRESTLKIAVDSHVHESIRVVEETRYLPVTLRKSITGWSRPVRVRYWG